MDIVGFQQFSSNQHSRVEVKACPLEVRMPAELKGDLEVAWLTPSASKCSHAHSDFMTCRSVKQWPNEQDLKEYGAIVFRGFDISKDKETFGQVPKSGSVQHGREAHRSSERSGGLTAMQRECGRDPLHSVAARDAVDKKAGVYEAVNKPSRSKFYIGMHNEMVGNRAPGAALFVCFKAAEKGGEFLVADGRKMFKKLDQDWLSKVYNRDVVYSTAEFPMGFIEGLPDFVKPAVEPMVYGAMTQAHLRLDWWSVDLSRLVGFIALKMKVDFQTELRWEKSDYDGSKILQVRAMPQYPIVRHHATGEPCWWGSMHSHAEHLRREREKVFGEAQEGGGETTEWLEHLDKVTLECAEKVKMEPGDMVLLDNYLVMHGRCPFEGTRLHAVSWFKSPDYSKAAA
ncbi:unnamed protein product [Durusdinium trenchii]|uniref:TauD/TfdA-like domain-containing protein n=1 Tax=Durusdinium trenchii TaxID=1381693 RepID=A0ABP0PDP6_9DINO